MLIIGVHAYTKNPVITINIIDALKLHYALSPLFRSMFIDTNPIPVKKAVELVGMAGGPVRLPLDNLDEKKTAELKKVLATIPAAKKTTSKKKPAAKSSRR